MIRENREHGATLLLEDFHVGEYTSVLFDVSNTFDHTITDGRVRADSFVRCHVVWSTFDISNICDDSVSETELEEIAKRLFPQFAENIANCALWSIYGRVEGLRRAFDVLADALTGQAHGGDDDVFDYFPNTLDVLHAFATDMCVLDPSGRDYYASRVKTVADEVKELDEQLEASSGIGHQIYREEWEIA